MSDASVIFAVAHLQNKPSGYQLIIQDDTAKQNCSKPLDSPTRIKLRNKYDNVFVNIQSPSRRSVREETGREGQKKKKSKNKSRIHQKVHRQHKYTAFTHHYILVTVFMADVYKGGGGQVFEATEMDSVAVDEAATGE